VDGLVVSSDVVRGDLRENLSKRDHWGDPGMYGKIILKWIFRKWDVKVWPGLAWLRIETGGGQF
jgi:hypothetical protein